MSDLSREFLSSLEQKYGLPSGMLYAQMMAESGGNPAAKSPKGALGAFQFMPATASEYGIDPLDPIQSAEGAARMNADMLKKYGGDVPSALAAYNWGQGNVDRKGLQNAPEETRGYISKIMSGIGDMIVSPAYAEEVSENDVPEGFVPEESKSDYDLGAKPWSSGVQVASLDEDVPSGFVPEEPKTEQETLNVEDNGQKKEYFSALIPELSDAFVAAGEDSASAFRDVAGAVSPLAALYRMSQGEEITPEQAKYLETSKPYTPAIDVAKGLGKGALASMGMLWSPVTAINKAFVGNPLENKTGIPSEYTDMALSLVEPMVAPKILGKLKAVAGTESGQKILGKLGKAVGGDVNASAAKYAGGITPDMAVGAEKAIELAPKVAGKAGIAPTSQAFHAEAQKAYAKAEELGGTLPANYVDEFVTSVEKNIPKTRIGAFKSNPARELSPIIEDIKGLKGGNLSLKESQDLDEMLGELAWGHSEFGKPTKIGKRLLDMQTSLRETMAKAAKDTTLNTEGFAEWKRGQKLWSQQMAMRDIERILTRAELSDQPATIIRNGFRTILSNPSRLRSFTKTEQEAIRTAAKTGAKEELLRAIGSRLTQYAVGGAGFMGGGVLGAIGGAAGAHAVSNMARNASAKLGQKKIAKVMETIAKR